MKTVAKFNYQNCHFILSLLLLLYYLFSNDVLPKLAESFTFSTFTNTTLSNATLKSMQSHYAFTADDSLSLLTKAMTHPSTSVLFPLISERSVKSPQSHGLVLNLVSHITHLKKMFK